MNIRIEPANVPKRHTSIKKVLRPIADNPKQIYVVPKNAGGDLILAAHGHGFSTAGAYNSLRFRTRVPRMFGMYYEWWKKEKFGSKEVFYLHRPYLHLYEVTPGPSETEFLLLHCDPNEPLSDPHAKYKQCIHLHIESGTSAPPHNIWPHVHIALNSTHRDLTLKTCETLSAAIENATEMLRDEVFPLL